jgi:hypothetical protein
MHQETPSTQQSDEQRQLDRLRHELMAEFGQRLDSSVVDARFDAIVGEFQKAPVRTFIPVLARRRLRRLLAAASSDAG